MERTVSKLNKWKKNPFYQNLREKGYSHQAAIQQIEKDRQGMNELQSKNAGNGSTGSEPNKSG